jgi:hypothetical protein
MAIEQYYFLGATATDTPVTVNLTERTCRELGFIKHDGTTGTLHVQINGNEFVQLKAGESVGDRKMKIYKLSYKAGTGESVPFRILAFVNED